MNMRTRFARSAILLSVGIALGATFVAARQQPPAPFTGTNYLYIEEFELAPGTVMNDAIAEASQWVRDHRKKAQGVQREHVRLFRPQHRFRTFPCT